MTLSAPEPADVAGPFARVLVDVEPFHLDRPFDYAIGAAAPVAVGDRVEVVFSGRVRKGLVAEVCATTDVPAGRIRPLKRRLGDHSWMDEQGLGLIDWAAQRFGGTRADVIRHALPPRTVAVERAAAEQGWYPPRRQARSVAAADQTVEVPAGWVPYGPAGADVVASAGADGGGDGSGGSWVWRPLPGEDVAARLTEVVRACLAGGRDALVITPDGASRVARAMVESLGEDLDRDQLVDVRGKTSPRSTYRAWLRARCGIARVIVGERGTAFWPLQDLGLTVVIDEANPALKEIRSPRHHVREVALERARRSGATALLVTTVPSAATWKLLRERRLTPVFASRDDERRRAPVVRPDTPEIGRRTRLGRLAVPAIRAAVADGRYAVVLAARGGIGSALVCGDCGHRLRCPECTSSVADRPGATAGARRIRHCRVCGWSGPARRCSECSGDRTVPLAAGAEQLGAELRRTVDAPVAVLEGHDQPAPPAPAVLVTTRGSVLDAPPGRIGAIVISDFDALVRRPEISAPEDALRLAMALANWAAFEDNPPDVIVRTDEPDSPAVQSLLRWDPGGFWRGEATRRAPLGFPPARSAVSLTAHSDQSTRITAALAGPESGSDSGPAADAGTGPDPDVVLGPIPTDGVMMRWLVLTDDRARLLGWLRPVREELSKEGLELRVDVDPLNLG